MKYFWCALLASIASARLKANNIVEVSVLINGNQNTYQVVEGIAPNADVTASYMDGMSSVGWGLLNVTITNKQGTKGYLTSVRIYEIYMNTYNVSGLWDFTNGPSATLREFLNTQQQYMDSQIEAHSSNDQFWWYAKLLQEQFNGLWYGYNLSITEGY
ncbi:phospholipase B-like protein, partial [Reticulomyxa filosa]